MNYLFKSLMAWGKKLFLSLLVRVLGVLYRLPEGRMENRLLWGCVVLNNPQGLPEAPLGVKLLQAGQLAPSALRSTLVQLPYQVVKQPVRRLSMVPR